MRTLHVDSGRELRGGQWQALYLIERLSDAVLLARARIAVIRGGSAAQGGGSGALVSSTGGGRAAVPIWCMSTMRGRIRWRRWLA